jgi:hypothetical protein
VGGGRTRAGDGGERFGAGSSRIGEGVREVLVGKHVCASAFQWRLMLFALVCAVTACQLEGDGSVSAPLEVNNQRVTGQDGGNMARPRRSTA